MKQTELSAVVGAIEEIAKMLVEYPQKISVHVASGTVSATMSIECHKVDVPKLIGAGGLTHKALATLATRMATRHGFGIEYERLREPVGSSLERPARVAHAFVARENWAQAEIVKVTERAVAELFGEPFVINLVNGANSSTLEILVPAGTVDSHELSETQEAMSRVWHAIGRTHGRILTVRLAETFDLAQERQPDKADGRYVKERKR